MTQYILLILCSFLSAEVRSQRVQERQSGYGSGPRGGHGGGGHGGGGYGGGGWTSYGLNCSDISMPISASAANLVIPSDLNLSAITAADISTVQKYGNNYSTQNQSGFFNISARYCEPQVRNSRSDTLQFLVHGDGYDKNYWSGLGPPGQQPFGTKYSWIDYASLQGYPTLSVDRICNGNSSKPDGTSICQVPMNAAVSYQIIQAARNGQFGGRRMKEIVYIGHSLGSIIANYLARTTTDNNITYILTGFTPYANNGSLGTLVATSVRPANSVSPAYASYTDASYLLETNATGYRGVFYYGDYDENVEAYDYANRGTVTVGELISNYLGQSIASGYTGNLFALDGANDQIFCSRSIYDPIQGNLGNCGPYPGINGSTYAAAVHSLYPGVKKFDWYLTSQTGHCLNLHDSFLTSFQAAQSFLISIGL